MQENNIMNITDEQIAAYLEGNISPKETQQILSAMKHDEELREVLSIALDIDEEAIITDNDVLPMMSLAADDHDANLCALKCEAHIMEKYGISTTVEELLERAKLHKWTKEEGTPMFNVGRHLERVGLIASRRYYNNIDDIERYIARGGSVIAVIDSTQNGKPNHSIVIESMDGSLFIVFDPDQNNNPIKMGKSVFAEKWEASKRYMVVIDRFCPDEYEPRPIDITDVELGSELNELQEAIAENAHEVWAEARKSQGWSYGMERNDTLKQTPDMLPYSQLPEIEKQYDRDMAINTLKLVKKLGYDIVKRK